MREGAQAIADARACASWRYIQKVDRALRGPEIAGGVCAGGMGDNFIAISDLFSAEGDEFSPERIMRERVKEPIDGWMAENLPGDIAGIPLPVDMGSMCSAIRTGQSLLECLDVGDLGGLDTAFSLDALLGGQLAGLGDCDPCDYGQLADVIDRTPSALTEVSTHEEITGTGDCTVGQRETIWKTNPLPGTGREPAPVDGCAGRGCVYDEASGTCARPPPGA